MASKKNPYKRILALFTEEGLTQATVSHRLRISARETSDKFIALVSLDHIVVDRTNGGPNGNAKVYKLAIKTECQVQKPKDSTS